MSEIADESPQSTDTRRSTPSLGGRARILSALTLGSRLLGVVREQIFARLFGGGLYADALVVAFRIPNLLRDLFAEGALSAALVPALGRARADGGDAAAARLASAVLSFLALVVGVLTIVGVLFTPSLVDLLAGGFAEGEDGDLKRAEVIRLTQILFPFLLLLSCAAVLRGVLNVQQRFAVPAFGPPAANALAIATGIGLLISGASPAAAATGWAIALLGGGLVTLLIQVPAVRATGWHVRPTVSLRHPELIRVVRHLAFAALSLAAIQVNIVVGTTLASHLEPGSVAALNYAFRLVYLPIGVIGVAIATVSTVDLSERVAAGRQEEAAAGLVAGLRLTAFLALPSAVGLWVLSEPVVRLIYEYEKFSAADTARTAAALRGYGVGLVFYAMTKVQVPACYAVGSARLPVFGAIGAMVGFTTFALFTYQELGVLGLGLGTALAASLNAAVLAIGLRKTLPGGGSVLRGLLIAALLAAGMGVVCSLLAGVLDDALGNAGLIPRLLTVALPTVVGFLLVVGVGRWLRLPEADEVWRVFQRRRGSADGGA